MLWGEKAREGPGEGGGASLPTSPPWDLGPSQKGGGRPFPSSLPGWRDIPRWRAEPGPGAPNSKRTGETEACAGLGSRAGEPLPPVSQKLCVEPGPRLPLGRAGVSWDLQFKVC